MEILKQGYLMKKPRNMFANLKKWKSKWLVLTFSNKDGLKFHIFISHEDAIIKNSIRKCIVLDKTTKAIQSYSSNHSFVISITNGQNSILTVAASCNEDMILWCKAIELAVDKLNQPVKSVSQKLDSISNISRPFSNVENKKPIDEWIVELIPSSVKSDEKLEGKYIMAIDNIQITLKNNETKIVERSWPFSSVLSCARSKTRFTFEVLSNSFDTTRIKEKIDVKGLDTLIHSFICPESITIYNLIEKYRPKSAASTMSKLTSRYSFANHTQFVMNNVQKFNGRPTVLSEEHSHLFKCEDTSISNTTPICPKSDKKLDGMDESVVSLDCRISVRIAPVLQQVEKVNSLKLIPAIYRNFSSFSSFDYYQRNNTKITNVKVSRSKTFETNRIPLNTQVH